MDSPKLVVLDVGHGNSAVLHDSDGLVIFDAGLGGTLDEYLQACNIKEVIALLVSHSDADHLSGASNILLSEDIKIGAVYLNGDSDKSTVAYMAFRIALESARLRNKTQVHTQLTITTGSVITAGNVKIDVLAPGPSLATAGNGGVDLESRKIRSNTMSAVVRLSVGNRHAVLLAGDIDELALEHLLVENPDIAAETLVFPHHGGRPGRNDPAVFTSALVSAVNPAVVLFSTGRGKRNINPHPDVVAAVLKTNPAIHIGCTQLSMQCSANTPATARHLSALSSAGKEDRKCCIGTVEISLSREKDYFPILTEHLEFVKLHAATALCLVAR